MTEFEKMVNEYRENKRLIEDLNAENDALKSAIIDAMHGAEVVSAGACKVSYKAVTSSRLDTAALRKGAPDVYAAYSKSVTTRRFLIG